MNLLLLLIAPLLTAVAVLLSRNREQVKWISLVGALIQLGLSIALLVLFRQEMAGGHGLQMVFEQSQPLFASLGIYFHFGVDGISVAMILLTSFVLVAGVLVSWNIEKMTKEFYFLLILLALGAYGFFISLDLFILFFFLEISVIPTDAEFWHDPVVSKIVMRAGAERRIVSSLVGRSTGSQHKR